VTEYVPTTPTLFRHALEEKTAIPNGERKCAPHAASIDADDNGKEVDAAAISWASFLGDM
jgi:hypothetical protein